MGKKKRLQNSIGMIWKVFFQMGPDDSVNPMVLEMKGEDKNYFKNYRSFKEMRNCEIYIRKSKGNRNFLTKNQMLYLTEKDFMVAICYRINCTYSS